MQDFRNLKVWEKSHSLALSVYRATGSFPKEELYSLTSQIRRACTSVPANIAEGCVKGSDAEFARYVNIALGSASEMEYQLLLAHDLGYMQGDKHEELSGTVVEIKQMLSALLKKLRADSRKLRAH